MLPSSADIIEKQGCSRLESHNTAKMADQGEVHYYLDPVIQETCVTED